MQSDYSLFSRFRWLAGSLVILCVLGNGLSAWIGGGIAPQLIALTFADGIEQADTLHLMDAHYGLAVPVSDQPISCCAKWSRDGTRIAFTGLNGDVLIWDMQSGKTRSVPLPDMRVTVNDWSPDGQFLLVTHQRGDTGYRELYRVAINGNDLQQLTTSNDPFKRINFAQWSADGRFMIFVQGASYITRLWEIYRIDSDGQNLRQISDGEGISYSPQLSPDGRRIVFMEGSAQSSDLFVMNADGSDRQRATWTDTDERMPVWSPDGTQIVFQTYISPDFPRALEVMNADGTGRRRLADDAAFDAGPAWSPDGRQLVYEAQRERGTELYLVDANGTNARLLLKNVAKTRLNPSWQPHP